jgi:hypothetical protein
MHNSIDKDQVNVSAARLPDGKPPDTRGMTPIHPEKRNCDPDAFKPCSKRAITQFPIQAQISAVMRKQADAHITAGVVLRQSNVPSED